MAGEHCPWLALPGALARGQHPMLLWAPPFGVLPAASTVTPAHAPHQQPEKPFLPQSQKQPTFEFILLKSNPTTTYIRQKEQELLSVASSNQ